MNTLPNGWTESAPGRLMTNKDVVNGGIIDRVIGTNEWFVIPENPDLTVMDGFTSRDQAFNALTEALTLLAAI